MYFLNKERHCVLRDQLGDAYSALLDAVSEYNGQISELAADVNRATREYNKTLANCAEFAHENVEELRRTIQCASEKWLNSDEGRAVVDLHEKWRAFDPRPSLLNVEEELEEPEEDTAEAFYKLPTVGAP